MSGSHDWGPAGPLLGIAAAGALLSEARAQEPEPLDEEFLDYLLQLEGDDEDWTLFDSQESDSRPRSTSSATSTSPTSTSKPAPAKEPAAKSTPASAAPAKPTSEVKR